MLEGPYGGKLAAMAVWGSSLEGTKPGSDLDVLAIFENSPPSQAAAFGRLDMAFRGMSEVEEGLRRLDPSLVQPIMTGRPVFGKRVFKGIKVKLEKTVPTSEYAPWLVSRSLQMTDWVERVWKTNDDTPSVYATLGFAVSFMATARLYAEGIGRIVLLEELVELMPPDERKILIEARRQKRIGGTRGLDLLELWKRCLHARGVPACLHRDAA